MPRHKQKHAEKEKVKYTNIERETEKESDINKWWERERRLWGTDIYL